MLGFVVHCLRVLCTQIFHCFYLSWSDSPEVFQGWLEDDIPRAAREGSGRLILNMPIVTQCPVCSMIQPHMFVLHLQTLKALVLPSPENKHSGLCQGEGGDPGNQCGSVLSCSLPEEPWLVCLTLSRVSFSKQGYSSGSLSLLNYA